jgi:hypothetical protein
MTKAAVMTKAPAAMPSDDVARHQTRLRWGWGPSAIEKKLISTLGLATLWLLALAAPALAGPPFVCHPFEIGTATSLPSDPNNWLAVRADYDIHRVVADTDALLTPSTPTLVRMETLRRAALYASLDRGVAEQLIAAMMGRVQKAEQSGQSMAAALFDAGYVVEALSEIEQFGNHMKEFAGREKRLAGLTHPYDGRALIQKSLALRPGDASIEFALTLLFSSKEKDKEMHLRNARAGATQDSLLASNLAKLQLR